MGIDDSEFKELQSDVGFKELLIKTTLSEDRAVEPSIRSINLGKAGRDAEALLDRSLADEEGMERGRWVLVTDAGGYLLQQRDMVGKKGEGANQSVKSNLRLNENKNAAVFIHSHGVVDVPTSPQDIISLFLKLKEGGVTATFVITPEKKSLIFRGPKTPTWDRPAAEDSLKNWVDSVNENIKSSIQPHMSREEQVGINAMEIHKFLRDLADKYDLQMFSCPSEKNIATRNSA